MNLGSYKIHVNFDLQKTFLDFVVLTLLAHFQSNQIRLLCI